MALAGIVKCLTFQSTPPHGGRLFCDPSVPQFIKFQSTPPHGGRLILASIAAANLEFQSTPPHGGRPPIPPQRGRLYAVSIHAPAWGATTSPRTCAAHHGFQSTPPHGGRPDGSTTEVDYMVSIHAPAWGATSRVIAYDSALVVSIHAPAWGATAQRCTSPRSSWFQSTPPHGGRLPRLHIRDYRYSFNPRPRMGGDLSP